MIVEYIRYKIPAERHKQFEGAPAASGIRTGQRTLVYIPVVLGQTVPDLIEVKLVQGSVFYSQGAIVVPSEIPNKAPKGVEVCAHVRLQGDELSAGKIFLERTCESFTPPGVTSKVEVDRSPITKI